MRELLQSQKLTDPARSLMDPMPFESLYDTEAAPHEIKNLAESAPRQQILRKMRTALDTWEIETGDRGEIKEPQSVVAPFEKEMHGWFGTPSWHN